MKLVVKGIGRTKLREISCALMFSSLILAPIPGHRIANLHGRVVDCENDTPLKNVRVVVTEKTGGNDIQAVLTDANGYYRFDDLAADRDYALEASMGSIYKDRKIEVSIRRDRDTEAPRICLNEEAVPPLPPPQIISPCGPLFFPFNSRRINNEHKACLDEIALRLQQAPRSSLVIGGHCNSSERPGGSLTRAKNARGYLVNEKGIDAARISVWDYSSTCPHESRDKRLDRRVEFWIVPEDRKASDVRPICIAGATPRIRDESLTRTIRGTSTQRRPSSSRKPAATANKNSRSRS